MHIPSPPVSGFHIGPVEIHFYALMYLVAIAAAIIITRRRWLAQGGDPDLVGDVAIWAVPAGIVGGRIYFDTTTPGAITPHTWWGPLAVWNGGLGIWGAILLASLVGAWRVRRTGASVVRFMDAVAPALLVAQGIGRIGNYFNKELFGKPTGLPWGLDIPPAFRPPGFGRYSYFQPTFLYELIFDFALAAALVWLGHHRRIKPPGLFALYVAGYSAFRIFEETVRIDYSEHFLGLRLNFFVAIVVTALGLAWFAWSQLRPVNPGTAAPREPAAAAPSSQAAAVPSGEEAAGPRVERAEHAPPQGSA